MSDDYNYDLSVPRYRKSDERLIDSLKNFAKVKSCRYFATHEFDDWPLKAATAQTYIRRFGSWADALLKAGLQAAPRRNYTAEQLIDHLKACWQFLDHPPTTAELEQFGKRIDIPISSGPYRTRWGSVRKACECVAAIQTGRMTEDQLYKAGEKTPQQQRTVPLKLRYGILKRDAYTCVKCGAKPEPNNDVRLEVDHIVPKSKGGTDDLHNLQTLCWKCNQGKKDQPN